jgi:hypothetical protein
MLLSVTSRILSKTEIAFLSGSREFTKPQARCIRCRFNKKLKMLNVELAELENNFDLGTAGPEIEARRARSFSCFLLK